MLHDVCNFGVGSRCEARRRAPQARGSAETGAKQGGWATQQAQESRTSMGRISSLFAAVVCVASASGCGGLGLVCAAGHIPGVAATDYAFYNFCDVASQLYPASPSQIESSAIEALGDLGFTHRWSPRAICRVGRSHDLRQDARRPADQDHDLAPKLVDEREGRDRPGPSRRRGALARLLKANLL